MNQAVECGKTFLVDGPASVRVVSGKAEMLGFSAKDACRIVVREGKRLPFFTGKTTSFDISLGESASVEVDGNTIPPSLVEYLEVLMGFQKKPLIAMVRGEVDSGKTSRVLTSVSAKTSNIVFGKVRMEENLREVPTP